MYKTKESYKTRIYILLIFFLMVILLGIIFLMQSNTGYNAIGIYLGIAIFFFILSGCIVLLIMYYIYQVGFNETIESINEGEKKEERIICPYCGVMVDKSLKECPMCEANLK